MKAQPLLGDLDFSILGAFEEGVNRFEERLLLDGGRVSIFFDRRRSLDLRLPPLSFWKIQNKIFSVIVEEDWTNREGRGWSEERGTFLFPTNSVRSLPLDSTRIFLIDIAWNEN